jgi:hypothetical protein
MWNIGFMLLPGIVVILVICAFFSIALDIRAIRRQLEKEPDRIDR